MIQEDSTNNMKGRKVLIVDDVPENLQVLSHILDTSELEVSAAINGQQALDIAFHTIPDIILLDISMPEMDGFEVCKRLKNTPATNDIPIIFLTAKTDTEDIVEGFKLGAADYVTKPFNSQELFSRVKTQLELRAKTKQILRMNEHLEELVEMRTLELNKANQKLQRLDKAKSDFLLLVNHELRTPIHGIAGFLELLEEIPLPEEYKEFISFMNISVERLLKLSESALLITTIKSGITKDEFIQTDLLDSLNQGVKYFHSKINKKKCTINIDADADSYSIRANKDLIINCIKILLDNAHEHSPKDENIDITVRANSKEVMLQINDYGEGFNKKFMQDTFEFFRSGEIQSQTYGFGLGLASAKLILGVHDGSIKIGNHENGAQVIMKLPIYNNSD